MQRPAIQRLNPEYGSLDPVRLEALGVSQVVIAQGVAHWSGIVAMRQTAAGREYPAADMAGQLAFILDRIDECLAAVGTDRTRILTLTMFCTRLDELGACLQSVYAPWVGEHRPTVTTIGVSALAGSGLLLEVQGCALMPDA